MPLLAALEPLAQPLPLRPYVGLIARRLRVAEVPEVEIAVQDLRASVVGRVIERAEVLTPSVLRSGTPEDFARTLAGRRVLGVQRRAKWVLMALEGGYTLAIHFMLFGYLRLVPDGAPRALHTMLVLFLSGHEELRLLDRLGYARVALAPADELEERLGLATLGPEVLAEDFEPQTLEQRLRRKRVPIKPALLDQHVVAGLGNRDADESLWRARIAPQRGAGTLTHEEAQRLTHAMRDVLREGIARRGSMRDLRGRKGESLRHLDVFEREGEPCPRCGGPVTRIRQNGRNTFFCPACQQ